jgi:mono/diheme cytochrome c family protein
MNPPPPDLADRAKVRTPAELFWVTKHGIRMTGMPAWGPTHSDKQLWELVAFVEKLPELSKVEYQKLIEQGATHGHSDEHGGPAGTEAGQGHDQHSHVH